MWAKQPSKGKTETINVQEDQRHSFNTQKLQGDDGKQAPEP